MTETHNLVHRLSLPSTGLFPERSSGCASSDPQDPHVRVEGVNDTRVTPEPLEWSDPPAGHVGIWFELLAPCVAQPGRWALVRTFRLPNTAHTTARDLRKRRYHYQPGCWEFRGRRRSEGDCGLWARYLGPA